MRIAELRQREDYDTIAQSSLAAALSGLAGHTRVEWLTGSHSKDDPRSAFGDSQIWYEQRLFSTYTVRSATAPVRRFLAESMRFGPHPWLAAPRAALATLLASPLGLRTGRPAFRVSPPLPGADNLLILPGNRRIRIFDFQSGRSRVVAKSGTDAGILAEEVAFRQDAPDAPFLPVLASGPDWFEEPIVQGVPLPRLPPWRDQAAFAVRALDVLERFAAPRRRAVPLVEHVDVLEAALGTALGRLGFDGWSSTRIRRLVSGVRRFRGDLQVGPSHGDCQPGNALVDGAGQVVWTDWEFQAPRSKYYDRLVFALRFRFAADLSWRLLVPLAGTQVPLLKLPKGAADRRRALAVAVAEDIVLICSARASSGLHGPPPDLAELLVSLELLEHR